MSKLLLKTKEDIISVITGAIESAMREGKLPQGEIPEIKLEIPADRKNGDLSTNVAMAGARAFKRAPSQIAEAIADNIDLSETCAEKCEIAGPGFINFYLGDKYYSNVIKEIEALGKDYGKSDFGLGKKVNVEFVSANPTGPMHMGNARGGALGDCLAAVLEMAGYDVTREFYINDAGNQIDKFGLSLDARYMSLYLPEDDERCILPEDSYHGEDILDRAKQFAEVYGDKYVNAPVEERRKALVDFALPKNIQAMKDLMEKYNIEYDVWFPESTVHNSGEAKKVIDILTDKGLTYEKDGALWYKATEFGFEKDEVLIRSNGTLTYFTGDIAYHRNKLNVRGFDKAIDIWGADHHGHVARLKGALNAVGEDGDKLDVVLMQLVRLVKDGETVKMSKRTGKAITLDDLLNDIPVDAVRFLFNMRESTSQMDFDLDLAVEQSSQNPVYYVQYAHARIHSILKKLSEDGVKPRECSADELKLLSSNEERELIWHLSLLTDEVIKAAENYDPARITRYVIELATLFHKFYNSKRVAVDDESLMQARISLCNAVKDVIYNILTMFKVSAPEQM